MRELLVESIPKIRVLDSLELYHRVRELEDESLLALFDLKALFPDSPKKSVKVQKSEQISETYHMPKIRPKKTKPSIDFSSLSFVEIFSLIKEALEDSSSVRETSLLFQHAFTFSFRGIR